MPKILKNYDLQDVNHYISLYYSVEQSEWFSTAPYCKPTNKTMLYLSTFFTQY